LNVRSKSGANIIPDPERGPLIQQAFETFATGAETKLGVLKIVNSLGLRTAKGKMVTPQTFDRLLRNQLYMGWIFLPRWTFVSAAALSR